MSHGVRSVWTCPIYPVQNEGTAVAGTHEFSSQANRTQLPAPVIHVSSLGARRHPSCSSSSQSLLSLALCGSSAASSQPLLMVSVV